jgi:predicted RecB family nuclease
MLAENAISGPVFAAYLECETKAYLLQQGVPSPSTETQALRRVLEARFKRSALDSLQASVPEHEVLVGTPSREILRAGRYSLILGPDLPFSHGVARPDAIERLLLPGGRTRVTYRPVRFCWAEKPTIADRLTLAFDALAIMEIAGRPPPTGRVIVGTKYAKQTVSVTKLSTKARGVLKAAGVILAKTHAPVLALNKHCPACEYQARCRKLAIESDDLSLLPTMSAKARKKKINNGVGTVTQLSYTFRPPRRKRIGSGVTLKHDPALKALAIRTNRTHVIGTPALPLAGTAVYLDVEGVPDRSFYYLIGLRFRSDEVEVQRSIWADDEGSEREMWQSCLRILKQIGEPCLIHYGSYETHFLKRMRALLRRGGRRHLCRRTPLACRQSGIPHLQSNLFSHVLKRAEGDRTVSRLSVVRSGGFRYQRHGLALCLGVVPRSDT